MPKFGVRSRSNLESCDKRLQRVFNKVIEYVDCTVLEGHRSEDRQNKLYEEGRSKLKYPKGNHNRFPSYAVDVTPWPIDWEDRERQTLFAGFVLGIGRLMGYNIRWGGDWDQDFQVGDNHFDDFPHFEIKDNKKDK